MAAGIGLIAVQPAQAQGRPISLLSGGALEPAVVAALAAWRAQGGAEVELTFNTAPRITARLAAGERPDIVLAPAPALALLESRGQMQRRISVGSVGVGIAVRPDAPVAPIPDEAALRRELLAAEAVIFNQASTGLYMDRLLARMQLTETVTPKSVRFPDGDSVMRRVAAGERREIGFGAITEILLFRDKGVRLLGPLPPGTQNQTTYFGVLVEGAGEPAARLLAFLDAPATRRIMADAGVE
jgi:molybdate transport system substrate-binding protein